MYDLDYLRPASVDEAVQAIVRTGGRAIAGGQTLIGAMKLRMSQPGTVVDLGGIETLRGVRIEPGAIVVGAMTCHAQVAAHAEVRRLLPALARLAGGIGDRQVRNRGTIGGSLANCDPAACYPAAVLGLGATVRTDRRTIAADDFFHGMYETALEDGELITAVRFPLPRRAGYVKFKQQASGFALVGVFVAQTAAGVRVAVTGAASAVFRARAIEAALNSDFTPQAARHIAIAPGDLSQDLHASAAYRAHLVPVIAAQAVAQTLGDATP